MTKIRIPLKYLIDAKLESLCLKLPDPNVCLEVELKDYVGLSLGYRGFFAANEEVGKIVAAGDEKEEVCHVEFQDNKIATIWNINEWKTEYKRLLTVRKESERNRQERFRRGEEIDILTAKMAEKLKLPHAATRLMAEQIVSTNNRVAAQTFGLDISDWHIGDEELNKIIKDQNT